MPVVVAVEVEHLVARTGLAGTGGLLAETLAAGGHTPVPATAGLLRRSVDLNRAYADLQLGTVDGVVMALAEREELPVVTLDFGDFRTVELSTGPPALVVDEATVDALGS